MLLKHFIFIEKLTLVYYFSNLRVLLVHARFFRNLICGAYVISSEPKFC